MDGKLFREAIECTDLPIGRVCTKPLKHTVEEDDIGCFRLQFTLHTRHYLTNIPLNERLSHRHELSWIVYSVSRGEIIGVISQNETSYQHPDTYVSLPQDKELVLIPSSPYIVNGHPAVASRSFKTHHNAHSYRYEIQVGGALDSVFIGENWSYREGPLCFGNWFNNKLFRWSFDKAELILPTVAGAPCCVLVDAHATTDFEVLVSDEVVASFTRSRGGVRWHNEDRRIDIPARLIAGGSTTLVFRFVGTAWENIEFNLRQEGLALSRVVVDIFDKQKGDLACRIASTTWTATQERGETGFYSFERQVFHPQECEAFVPQATICISPVELRLIERYFAPHEQFWSAMQGVWLSLMRLGISACVRPIDDLSAAKDSDSVIIGPLRYEISSEISARQILESDSWIPARRGVVLSHSIPSLILAGLPINDEALGAVAYRELFEAHVVEERTSNFWEMIITVPNYWASHELFIYENGMIGRPNNLPALMLASASAEDWMEMGDPDALAILERFCSSVSGKSPFMANGLPCAVAFEGSRALLAVYDPRRFSDSGGSGIARGWPSFRGPSVGMPAPPKSVYVANASEPTDTGYSRLLSAVSMNTNNVALSIIGGICTGSVSLRQIQGATT